MSANTQQLGQENVMALGPIVTILSNIPWASVIEGAPKIADSAKRLWNSISNRKPKPIEIEDVAAESDVNRKLTSLDLAPLTLRIHAIEASAEEFRAALLDATKLISELAQQNTALVERIELNRRRIQRQMIGILGVAVFLTAAAIYLIIRA